MSLVLRRLLLAWWPVLLRRVRPVGRPVALGGAALLAVACFLPWAGYSGFPGKMTLAGTPGGARLHVLLLALLAVLLIRPRDGVWRAGRRASAYALVDVVLT